MRRFLLEIPELDKNVIQKVPIESETATILVYMHLQLICRYMFAGVVEESLQNYLLKLNSSKRSGILN
jgi:hypothetical protein